jgi:hypothetical protein
MGTASLNHQTTIHDVKATRVHACGSIPSGDGIISINNMASGPATKALMRKLSRDGVWLFLFLFRAGFMAHHLIDNRRSDHCASSPT